MRYIELDPKALDTPEKMHAAIADALAFQPAYGRNLDALYDELTTYFQLVSFRCVRRAAYPFADKFYKVLFDAAMENGWLRVAVLTV